MFSDELCTFVRPVCYGAWGGGPGGKSIEIVPLEGRARKKRTFSALSYIQLIKKNNIVSPLYTFSTEEREKSAHSARSHLYNLLKRTTSFLPCTHSGFCPRWVRFLELDIMLPTLFAIRMCRQRTVELLTPVPLGRKCKGCWDIIMNSKRSLYIRSKWYFIVQSTVHIFSPRSQGHHTADPSANPAYTRWRPSHYTATIQH